jgi:hypothetical protein
MDNIWAKEEYPRPDLIGGKTKKTSGKDSKIITFSSGSNVFELVVWDTVPSSEIGSTSSDVDVMRPANVKNMHENY